MLTDSIIERDVRTCIPQELVLELVFVYNSVNDLGTKSKCVLIKYDIKLEGIINKERIKLLHRKN